MRVPVFILFMAMTMGLYAQKYKVGTTTALWKVPASTDFSQAWSVGVEYVEVASVIEEFRQMKLFLVSGI